MATELIESFNYEIKGSNWQPLTDIMGQDYETEVSYVLYVNGGSHVMLGYTQRTTTPSATDKGRELKAGMEVSITDDNGDHIYLRATGAPVNIEVREVPKNV